MCEWFINQVMCGFMVFSRWLNQGGGSSNTPCSIHIYFWVLPIEQVNKIFDGINSTMWLSIMSYKFLSFLLPPSLPSFPLLSFFFFLEACLLYKIYSTVNWEWIIVIVLNRVRTDLRLKWKITDLKSPT